MKKYSYAPDCKKSCKGCKDNKDGKGCIVPYSPKWENMCKQCGTCCFVKVQDEKGDIWLTTIACDHLDKKTRKCKCYSSDISKRGDAASGCLAHDGVKLSPEVITSHYILPAFCPYVTHSMRVLYYINIRANPIEIPVENSVDESEIDVQKDWRKYVIPNSNKWYKYLKRTGKIR